MNKALFEKVKAKCNDYGLSEKYLITITEKLGGSIEDDSTDENAIDEMANHIAEIAVETQGEATRWVNKKKANQNSKKKDGEEADNDDSNDGDAKKKIENPNSQNQNLEDERIAQLENKIAELESQRQKAERESVIKAAQAKHKIPDWRMKGLHVPDDVDVDEFLADIRQDLITQKLIPADSDGAKSATEKQVDEAADSLLESITAK